MSNPARSRAPLVLMFVLLAHLVWCVARVPHSVWWKRYREVRQYEEQGAASYFLDNRFGKAAEPVEWLLAHSPENSVILWRGHWKGAFEIAAAALFPRLLVHEQYVAPAAREWKGRPLAIEDGRPVVLIGNGIRLERALR